MAGKPKLMISYSHADKAEAERIRSLLETSFEILIDERYFKLSHSTKPEMKRMVGDADVVLVLLSPDSVASDAVRFEVRCALKRESDEQRKLLFAGMIRHCKPMVEWDNSRLYARLHSKFDAEFKKLKTSLVRAAAKALPKATAIPDSNGLYELARALLHRSGFKWRGEIEMIGRHRPHQDNPLTATVMNLDDVKHFRAFIATYDRWTMFFYFPRAAVSGSSERLFAFERMTTRMQIGTRFGAYLNDVASHRVERIEETESMIRAFRRFPNLIDVVLSPYSGGSTYAKRFDVKALSWPGNRAVLFYREDETGAGYATLPLLVAPKIETEQNLTDAMRMLKAALRTELHVHRAKAQRWDFFRPRPLRKRKRQARARGSSSAH